MSRRRLPPLGWSIHERKSDGRWVGVEELPRIAGKRKRLYLYGAGADPELDVLDQIAELERKATRSGISVRAPDRTTVEGYLAAWLAAKKATVAGKTLRQYEGAIRTHILPGIGSVRLESLTALNIQTFFGMMATRGSRRVLKGATKSIVEPVGATMQRVVHTTLRAALNDAVAQRLIPYSPIVGVRPPKVPRREMHVWTSAEAQRFLACDVVRSHRLFAYFVLMLTTGMRPGEALGLQWSDVDFRQRSLSIMRSLDDNNGDPELNDVPKTKQRRRLTMSETTIKALRDHQKREMSSTIGIGVQVFRNRNGDFIYHRRLARTFDMLIAKSGLPRITLYELRHTFATLMLAKGVHVKIVSEILGHASIRITMDTYSHVLPTMQDHAAQMIDALDLAGSAVKRLSKSISAPSTAVDHEEKTP